jgi:hypothetical protein
MREGAHHVQPFGAKRGGVEGELCIKLNNGALDWRQDGRL